LHLCKDHPERLISASLDVSMYKSDSPREQLKPEPAGMSTTSKEHLLQIYIEFNNEVASVSPYAELWWRIDNAEMYEARRSILVGKDERACKILYLGLHFFPR